MNKKIKYFSLFTGIGGFEKGIQQAYENNFKLQHFGEESKSEKRTQGRLGSTFKRSKELRASDRAAPLCVGFSEIDKYATQIYQQHYPQHKNYGDITKIDEKKLPDFDLLCGGFPCQSFSIAGKRGGFADTRGTLFFDIARIVAEKRPRLLLLENVKGLLSHDEGRTFAVIIAALDELGYDCQWQVLNSKDFGVPQNRERILIVGHLRGTRRPEVFPFVGGASEDIQTHQGGVRQISPTIDATYHKMHSDGVYVNVEVGTLRTHKDGQGFRKVKSGLSPTIPVRAREDGSGQPIVSISFRGRKDGTKEEARTDGLAGSLRAASGGSSKPMIREGGGPAAHADRMRAIAGLPRFVDRRRVGHATL